MVDKTIPRPVSTVVLARPKRQPISAPYSVRVFNFAGAVGLQIRHKSSFMTVTLPVLQAEQLRSLIERAIADLVEPIAASFAEEDNDA